MALLVRPMTTGDGLGLRRFSTVEIGARYRVAQRFRMSANDLTAIEIRPVGVGPVAGRFRLVLRDRDYPNERVADVAAGDLVRDDRYVFRFAPIRESSGHEFQFELTPDVDDPGQGVALWATKGSRLRDGSLVVNDRPRWASLAFRTLTAGVSPLRALLRAGDGERPPRWLVLVGLFGSWIAVGVILRAVSAAAIEPPPTPDAAPDHT